MKSGCSFALKKKKKKIICLFAFLCRWLLVVRLTSYKYGTVNLQNELSVLRAVRVEQHIIWHNLVGPSWRQIRDWGSIEALLFLSGFMQCTRAEPIRNPRAALRPAHALRPPAFISAVFTAQRFCFPNRNVVVSNCHLCVWQNSECHLLWPPASPTMPAPGPAGVAERLEGRSKPGRMYGITWPWAATGLGEEGCGA